jgi:hypothetical protein
LIHPDDVGLVDPSWGRPFAVSSIFTPMAEPLGGAPIPVSGFRGTGIGLGVGVLLGTAVVVELPPVSTMLRPATPPPTTTTAGAAAIAFCYVIQ